MSVLKRSLILLFLLCSKNGGILYARLGADSSFNNKIILREIMDHPQVLDTNLEIFYGPISIDNIKEISSPPNVANFGPNTISIPCFNCNYSVKWGRLTLENKTNKNLICLFEFSWLDTVETYLNNSVSYQKLLSGYSIKDENLSIPGNPRFVSINISPESTKSIYFRFVLKMPYYFWNPINVTLHNPYTYNKKQSLRDWAFGLFVGLSLAMCIFLILFFMTFRERNFLNLIFYIILSNAYLLFIKNIAFDYETKLFSNYAIIPFIVALVTLAYINFISYFLSLKIQIPVLHKILWGLIWLFIVNNCVGIFLMPLGINQIITNVMGLVWLIVLFCIVLVLSIRNVSFMKYIFFSVLISVAANAVQLLVFVKILGETTFTEYVQLLGNCIQFLTFTYILVVKVVAVQREKIDYQFKLQRADFEQKLAIENVRTKISGDIHDEIGAGLTKISLMSQRLKINIENNKDVDSAILQKIAESSREITNNLAEIIWAANPKHDKLPSLLAYIRNYIARFFEDTNINYSIDFPEEIPQISVQPDLKRNLFLVVKEALNNIIKHASADKVDIRFRCDEKQFLLEISDNGKGMENLQGRDFGNGLLNMRSRTEAINGKLEISSALNNGTKILLQGILWS